MGYNFHIASILQVSADTVLNGTTGGIVDDIKNVSEKLIIRSLRRID